MQLSTVSGITHKRTISDADLEDFNSIVLPKPNVAITGSYNNYSNIKTAQVGSSRYSRLDASMPAVAFVNFNTSAGGLFLTNTVPPSYVKNFSCTRISNDVGSFNLELQCPISTFNSGSDDLNIKLINLFGHIDSDNVNDVNGYKCSLSYGWRGSSANSVIKYDNALVTGMTLSYQGNYYTYTIDGLINSVSEKSFETGVKILPLDALAGIDTAMSESAISMKDNAISSAATIENLLINDTDSYTIIIPKGSIEYTVDKAGNKVATGNTTETDITYIYTNSDKNTVKWSGDYTYCIGDNVANDSSKQYCYDTSAIQIKDSDDTVLDIYGTSTNDNVGLDLTSIKSGERISDKVEILANYLYGDKYDIEVAHKDREHTAEAPKQIATILKEIEEKTESDVAKDDVKSDTTNDNTTSLHTWLKQMVRACQDCTESDAFAKYEKYDTNGDKILSKSDLAQIGTTDSIANKWKKFGIDTYTYTQLDDTGDDTEILSSSAFGYRKMTEEEFNTYYKDYTFNYTDSDLNLIYNEATIQDFIDLGYMQSGKTGVSKRTYLEYSLDYDIYSKADSYANDSAELNELLESYDGIINGQATAVQYYMYFIDAVAGQSKGKIYIGPAKDEVSKYQYTVGNNTSQSTVLSFSTSENLVYLISAVKSYVSAANSGLYKTDATTGGIVKGSVDTSSDRVDTKEEYATIVANKILTTIATGQIKASLQLLSDATSRKIQTTDNISILCQANGGKVWFSGNYMVSSVKDTISESGQLSTSLELQFTQSSAFEAVKKIILTHLNNVSIETP